MLAFNMLLFPTIVKLVNVHVAQSNCNSSKIQLFLNTGLVTKDIQPPIVNCQGRTGQFQSLTNNHISKAYFKCITQNKMKRWHY